jgi:hypothetical protein
MTVERLALRFVQPAIQPFSELLAQMIAVHRIHDNSSNPAPGEK